MLEILKQSPSITASTWLTETKKEGLHVGIIPDGMRRWGKERGIELLETYTLAFHQLEQTIDFFFSNDVTTLSIFFLSADNLRRAPYEVESVLKAIYSFNTIRLPHILNKWECKFLVAGDTTSLGDENLVGSLTHLQDTTNLFSKRLLHACISYDPIQELQWAIQQSPDKDISNILKHLYVKEPLDLCIRQNHPLHQDYNVFRISPLAALAGYRQAYLISIAYLQRPICPY